MPTLGNFIENCRVERDAFLVDIDYCKDAFLMDSMHYRMFRDEASPCTSEDPYHHDTALEAELSGVIGALWPSSWYSAWHFNSRQVINFFHRQGISTLGGLASFRGSSFSEVKDEYPIFQRSQLVQELDYICTRMSKHGEDCWRGFCDSYGYDPDELRNELLFHIESSALEWSQRDHSIYIESTTNFTGSKSWTTMEIVEKLQNIFGNDGNKAHSEAKQLLGLLQDVDKIDSFFISRRWPQ